MYSMASSQGRFCLSKKIDDDKGQNSSTCDPWTARDFMEGMRLNSAQCEHCLSGIYSFLVSFQLMRLTVKHPVLVTHAI